MTVLAEGARGSISEKIIKNFDLRKNKNPQTFGLGIKEVWEVPEGVIKAGHLEHTVGWPTPFDTYAGGFLYAKSET